MTRHAHRDQHGQFTTAPAAGTSVVDISGDPAGEHDRPADSTVYAPHDYRFGPAQRLLPHRQQRVINTQTGEELSSRITDVRAIQARPYGRTATHVVETDGVPFWGEAPPEDTMRGYRRTPGSDGYRLRSMYQRPDVERPERDRR